MKMLAILIALVFVSASATFGAEPNPYTMPDNSFISISGTAVNPGNDGFFLDYGTGTVYVEMDDWDWYDESKNLLDGDKVTVYGDIDDDVLETTKIEAGSVYVESLGTYFYANSTDEESATDFTWVDYTPLTAGYTTLRGTVESKVGRNFTIDIGIQDITVDTATMSYNPLDDAGYQQVDVGDYVRVSGMMDYDFWEGRELEATSVITLMED
jgi:uncharacterized protein YdeI (BOF family)